MLKITLAIILLCTSLSAFSTVKEIRAEYNIIQKSVKDEYYIIKGKTFKDGAIERSKTIYLNSKGVVKKLHVDGGSDDSGHSKSYFYTDEGKLFFTFEQSADVHNGVNEVRRYYNDKMKLIKEIVTPLKKGEHRITLVYPLVEDALGYFREEF
jgi:hypothetical protein